MGCGKVRSLSCSFCLGVRVSSSSPVNRLTWRGISALFMVMRTDREKYLSFQGPYRSNQHLLHADNQPVQFPEPSNMLLGSPRLPCWQCVQHQNRQELQFPLPSLGGKTISLLWQYY